jgi:hypothetical protein
MVFANTGIVRGQRLAEHERDSALLQRTFYGPASAWKLCRNTAADIRRWINWVAHGVGTTLVLPLLSRLWEKANASVKSEAQRQLSSVGGDDFFEHALVGQRYAVLAGDCSLQHLYLHRSGARFRVQSGLLRNTRF